MFEELKYGKLKKVDLHGLCKEEARAELVYQIDSCDLMWDGLQVVHGFHSGQVLKNFVRDEFNNDAILRKIKLDASSTILIFKR